MKKILTSLFSAFIVQFSIAQAPIVIKSVEGNELKPASDAQNKWQNQTWNGMVFYQGTGSPTKLCVTDGTTAGTRFVATLGAGGFHAVLPAKDFVYIITSQVISTSPYTFSYEIWKSDGTTAGTSNVYNLPNAIGISNGGQFFSDRQATYNFCLDGTTNLLYFGNYDATNGNELWRTDGTSSGTFMVKDIKSGTGGSFPWGFCKIGNEVFFNATEVGFERKLWKTDGTAAGTVQVPVAEPFFIVDGAIAKLGNKMVLFAHNTVDGYEPYVSDGTAAGTFMLGNFNSTTVNSGNSSLPYVDEANLKANSKHCFLILHNGTDTSLYRTDGTISGTIRIAPLGSSIYTRVSSGGYSDVDENGIWIMKFNNSGSGNAETLYRSDGTLAGTYKVADNISYGQKLKTYKNALWFQARNTGSLTNVEPWRSGGNNASTNKAFDIAPGGPIAGFFYSSEPYGFFTTNNRFYFFAKNTAGNTNLYEYNGNFTFNGSVAGGNWSDSTNWNSGMPPGIVDTVFVNAGTANTLNVSNIKAYAGSIIFGNNATVNISNTTDTLFVANEITPGLNNSITGNGIVSANSFSGNSVQIKSGLSLNNLLLESNINLQAGTLAINNSIVLQKGSITLNAGNLLLSGSSSVVTTANNNYVVTNGSGSMQIENIGATARIGDILFPIGNTSYNPLWINNTGVADRFNAKVINSISTGYTGDVPGSLITSGAVNRTWLITELLAGNSNAKLTVQWNATDELPLFNRDASLFGHFTGSVWDYGAAGAATGTNPYTYSRTGITTFSPFGILNNNITTPVSDRSNNPIQLNVFPNPAKETVYITLTEQMQKENLLFQLYNSLGQLVLQKSVPASRSASIALELHELKKGMYYLHVKGKKVKASAIISKAE